MVAKEADVNHTTMHIKATTSSDNSTTTSTLSPTTTKKPVHSISAPLSPVGPEPSDSEWKFQVKLSNSFRFFSLKLNFFLSSGWNYGKWTSDMQWSLIKFYPRPHISSLLRLVIIDFENNTFSAHFVSKYVDRMSEKDLKNLTVQLGTQNVTFGVKKFIQHKTFNSKNSVLKNNIQAIFFKTTT